MDVIFVMFWSPPLPFVPKNGLFQDKIISKTLCNLLMVK